MWANSFREILPHWELVDSFTVIEAAALIAGFEPTSIDESLEWFRNKQSGLTVSDGIQEFIATLNILLGSIRSGNLKADGGNTVHLKEISIERSDLIEWMSSKGRRFRPAFFFPDERESGESSSGTDRQRLRQLEAENTRLIELVKATEPALREAAEALKRTPQRATVTPHSLEADNARLVEQVAELQRQLQEATATPQQAPQEAGPARQQATASPQDDDGGPLHPRREKTYLNTIGALVELIQAHRPGRDSEAAVIREIVANYGERQGISKRTLEDIFPEARKRLQSV